MVDQMVYLGMVNKKPSTGTTTKMGPRSLFNEMVIIAWELGSEQAMEAMRRQQRRALARAR